MTIQNTVYIVFLPTSVDGINVFDSRLLGVIYVVVKSVIQNKFSILILFMENIKLQS